MWREWWQASNSIPMGYRQTAPRVGDCKGSRGVLCPRIGDGPLSPSENISHRYGWNMSIFFFLPECVDFPLFRVRLRYLNIALFYVEKKMENLN